MEQYSITLNQACAMLGISRPTAANWIRTGRLQATRKDPSKPKSPYLTTRQAAIQAHRIDRNAVSAERCEECDEPIPEPRRAAVPGCKTCSSCQEEIELRNKQRWIQ
ncbi:TraR/DksA C4-type zinc finger protein [Enterobacter hormaechei]|nr:TraR/DksA C4-type zinc finger protein [Enterobacter hormaechei]MBK4289112.1 TraR/DksA C4-type zinc finger protein [Enterobacter hormaechei]MBK4314146.1 TraR/DksA C4-type zinc finger protein [Enterobacter hormaechei]